jgi:tetratricopeptide (TPR) repeat protein
VWHCSTVLLLLSAAPLAAQQSTAESALALARAGRPDSALVILAQARAADPRNLELQLAQARVLSWTGRSREAIARYDSLLAENPSDPDALVGLGYVYHWQGKERAAARQADAALAADSTNADARDLRRAIRLAGRGSIEVSGNWSNDSDRNTNFWQTLSLSLPVDEGGRLLGSGGLLEASDPVRNATRVGGEGGLSWRVGRFQATGLAGARRLDPETGDPRTVATYRGSLSWRPVDRLGLGVGYARYPFDEIASLFERDLDIESLEGGFDARLSPTLLLTGGGGALWLSDGNRRTEGRAALTQDIGSHFSLGADGRALGYRKPGIGYFSPDRFHLLEATGAIRVESGGWNARLSGGLGGQQIGRGGDTQTEWHVEARVGKGWGEGNRLEGFGGVTNSAVSSTTGAFRYRSAGLLLRVGI